MDPNSHPSPVQAATPSGRGYQEHRVPRGPHHPYARDHPGTEPAIVLLHGFPDNLHLYDRLVPQLTPRRVVTFDFLGWGASDKPTGNPYTASNQTRDLDAVITHPPPKAPECACGRVSNSKLVSIACFFELDETPVGP